MNTNHDIIRERRFSLQLYKLGEELQELEGEPICQLAYFNANFTLNGIPQAVVSPLFGIVINQNETYTSEGILEREQIIDTFLDIASRRIPVAVVLRVNHSFSSDKDNKVVDKQYWKPSINTHYSDYHGPGLYDTDKYIIFKGYLMPPTINIVANNTQVRLTIVHWLSDIADISLLTSACHTSVPNEFALQSYSTPTQDKKEDNAWAIITATEDSFTEPKSLWEQGIKIIFEAALNYYTNDKFFNRYVKTRRKGIQLALNNIKADDTLEFLDKFTDNTSSFNTLVGFALKSENYQNFINVTAWDKLIRQYAPAFLFSIVPRVEDALLIPTPSIEYLDEDNIITINNDEIFSVMSFPITNNILNRVVCVPAVPSDISRSIDGPPTYISLSTYPDEDSCDNRSGFISTITYPTWLGLPVSDKLDAPAEQYKPEQDPSAMLDADSETRNKKLAIRKIKQSIADQYTKFAYLTQSYGSTFTNLTLPCRMDICPGAMIKCNVQYNNKPFTFYGTVSSVTINMLPGENTSNTQITLINVRVSGIANNVVENPQNEVGFYKKQWTGKDVALYDNA